VRYNHFYRPVSPANSALFVKAARAKPYCAMLVAEGILAAQRVIAARVSWRTSWIVSGALSAVVATDCALSAPTLPRESCGTDVHVVVR
jgi:hypothetical protein